MNLTYCISYDSNNVGLLGLKFGNRKLSSCKVWYLISREYWNQGLATDSLETICEFCFRELNLHRIEAGCVVENEASSKVLIKVGFNLEAHKLQVLNIDGSWRDIYEYALISPST